MGVFNMCAALAPAGTVLCHAMQLHIPPQCRLLALKDMRPPTAGPMCAACRTRPTTRPMMRPTLASPIHLTPERCTTRPPISAATRMSSCSMHRWKAHHRMVMHMLAWPGCACATNQRALATSHRRKHRHGVELGIVGGGLSAWRCCYRFHPTKVSCAATGEAIAAACRRRVTLHAPPQRLALLTEPQKDVLHTNRTCTIDELRLSPFSFPCPHVAGQGCQRWQPTHMQTWWACMPRSRLS